MIRRQGYSTHSWLPEGPSPELESPWTAPQRRVGETLPPRTGAREAKFSCDRRSLGHTRRMEKDRSLLEVLEHLRRDLGNTGFDLVDHWDADSFAIGIGRPTDHRYLVYVSTCSGEQGKLAYECERPSEDPEMPYSSDGMVESAAYSEVVDVIRKHLTE